MSERNDSQLHIPQGINFDCTFCGNCCFQWPVPITAQDFENISEKAKTLSVETSQLFRVLNAADDKLRVFSHSLEKQADSGLCVFLSEEKRCRLHELYGPEAKPAMCRLFPYTFTSTPEGVFASVSFAASGVLYNHGQPLAEQKELLERRHSLFNELFPNMVLDWSGIQLIDGVPLSWKKYSEVESPLLERLSQVSADGGRVEQALFDETERFRKLIDARVKVDNIADLTSNQKMVDLVLLKHLLTAYFPKDVYRSSVCTLDAKAVAQEFLLEPKKVSFKHQDKEFGFQDLLNLRLGRLPNPAADLLRRFVYLRVFSKLYFGPGFNYLSVVSGLHHLAVVICLLRIRMKLELLSMGLKSLDQIDYLTLLAENARTLEKRLTVATFDQEAMALLEILLLSPKRVERIVSLAG